MKEFLDNLIRSNKGAIEALKSLSNGAAIRVVVNEKHDFLLSKSYGKINFDSFENSSATPDITVRIPEKVLSAVFSTFSDNASDFIVNSAKIMTDKTNRENIAVSAHSGLIKLTLMGYLKVIPIGGSRLLKILSEFGIGSVSEIKKKLAKLTNR